MECCEWIALLATLICLFTFLSRFFGLVKMGAPKDLSTKSGDLKGAMKYSFINAMSPAKKESAFLHLPTYIAGIIYHIGTFLTLLIFVLSMLVAIFDIEVSAGCVPSLISNVVAAVLLITSMSGVVILVKRILSKELRSLSGADDYISNIITTLAQLMTALYLLLFPSFGDIYFITLALFFLWLPIGKTKHLMYFFFARYHLGFFYGWRGTWPQK